MKLQVVLFAFLLLSAISATFSMSSPLKRVLLEADPPISFNATSGDLTLYGKWCGGGHGGFQDCCNGGPCPACDPNSGSLTAECLQQCPPIDDMDALCSRHDSCCFTNTKPDSLSCSPQGNACKCDCEIVSGAAVSGICNNAPNKLYCQTYAFGLPKVFQFYTSCFTFDNLCHQGPVGNLSPYC